MSPLFDVLAAGDHGPGADHGVLADLDRGHHDRTGADEGPIADLGLVLAGAVEIGGDRPGADVDVPADHGIAQVGQVAGDRPGFEVRAADLDERADLDATFEDRAVAEVGERADPAVGPILTPPEITVKG